MTGLNLRANSPEACFLEAPGIEFLLRATSALARLVPHIELKSKWTRVLGDEEVASGAVWRNANRTIIELRIQVPCADGKTKLYVADARRKEVGTYSTKVAVALDKNEHLLCGLVAEKAAAILGDYVTSKSATSLRAISAAFEEHVVAAFISRRYSVKLDVEDLLAQLHLLSEMTYENKAIPFGCLIKTSNAKPGGFPSSHLRAKKYRALSDGVKTAYLVSGGGALLRFKSLGSHKSAGLQGAHYFPEWLRPMAAESRKSVLGLALTRSGDLAVIADGTMRLTYRLGQWQYWNHGYLIQMLVSLARAQKVNKRVIARIVNGVYRIALDLSFRRSGGLLVLLRRRQNLSQIASAADTIGGAGRTAKDSEFDKTLDLEIERTVLVELAALDGAVILNNSAALLAYGAVLRPRRKGHIKGSEGSRTKAAIGASYYGLAIKVSSDGDTTVYSRGRAIVKF